MTAALQRLQAGEGRALDELLPLVYGRLRALAASYYDGARRDATLQPTALVHEAYLRLVRQDDASYQNRAHFFAVAATAMRQILVDRVRRSSAQKRGGDRERVTLTGLAGQGGADSVIDMLALGDALEALAAVDERQARIADLRLFGGLTVTEIAQALSVSTSTVEKEWRRVRAFLMAALA